MMHKIFTPNKFSHNLLRPFEVLTSSVVTSCAPGEALKKTTFFCFVLWILEIVQLLAGQCCLQVSASVKQVKLQPPPVQFCWQFKPWHSNEQFPELHSWTHAGESHIPLHPPSGHRYGDKKHDFFFNSEIKLTFDQAQWGIIEIGPCLWTDHRVDCEQSLFCSRIVEKNAYVEL